ncbi:MAG: hypothetical protein IKP28_04755 [Clostridia bacterium]|nr:hypothetical protein [Clostridia bacterium]
MGKIEGIRKQAFTEVEAISAIFVNNMAEGFFDLKVHATLSVIFRADKKLKEAIEAQLIERYGRDGFTLKKLDEPERTYRLTVKIQ